MKGFNNIYAQRVFALLVPLIGDSMARSVIKFQSYKLGKQEEVLTSEDLPRLANEIRSGLLPFVGSDTAAVISSKILSSS